MNVNAPDLTLFLLNYEQESTETIQDIKNGPFRPHASGGQRRAVRTESGQDRDGRVSVLVHLHHDGLSQ